MIPFKFHPKHLIMVVLGAFAVWLILWRPVEFTTLGLDHGIWDLQILTNAVSIGVGIVILSLLYLFWRYKAI